MEIRELAESVLFADSLAGKLLVGDQLSDRQPKSKLAVPTLPGRPRGMRLDDDRPRDKFPGLAHGVEPTRRGQVLHHFANHELLAIELLADIASGPFFGAEALCRRLYPLPALAAAIAESLAAAVAVAAARLPRL